MPRDARRQPLERFTLPNGLRVLLAPDPGMPAVGVWVGYDVGFRSEPEGRTGFAHLFEHLMFQGSESVPKLEHAALIQGAGGVLNGSTHPDYTQYFEVVPSSALELALFLEADRMRAPSLTEENLRNQVDVVEQEINVNVKNQPYGGFPWITLPPLLFRTFPNAHNGYGDFSDLEAATVEDARDFFRRFYGPGNAVLTVAGSFEVDRARSWIESHFADVPARRVAKRPSFAEPAPGEERRDVVADPLAPQPALAVGWRVPDPADLDAYLPFVLLGEVLSSGDAARLPVRLVLRDRLVTGISAYLGTFGDPFDMRDPTILHLRAIHAEEVSADRILAVVDEELARIADEGVPSTELARVRALSLARLYGHADQLMGRLNTLGSLELIHGRAELLEDLPEVIDGVAPASIADAARRLLEGHRAVQELRPGGRP
jgi:predicted Zn-dependent peptidase